MAQIIDFNTIRAGLASKAYSPMKDEPYFQVGNLVLCGSTDLADKEKLVKGASLYSNCEISEEALLDYMDGNLDELSSSRMSKHVAECSTCSELLNEFENLRQHAEGLRSSENLDDAIKLRLRNRLKSELGLTSDL